MNRHDFTGQVAVVTGAAAGMGRATARALAAAGAQVVLADVAEDAGEAVAREIADAGGTARFVRTDVSHEDDVAAMVDAAMSTYGRLDVAVNAAGIEVETTFLADADVDTFDRVVAVNLRSIFLCMRSEIGAMLRDGSGADASTKKYSLFRRFGDAAEVANAVLWLCSDESSFTSGHILAVDGGLLAH